MEVVYHFAIEELCIIWIYNVQQILILFFPRGKRFIRETSNPPSVFSVQKARVNLRNKIDCRDDCEINKHDYFYAL